MIYLVEDDANIRELVLYALNRQDLPAEGFSTPSAFREALVRETPELILLDIMLPEENGLSLLSFLKSNEKTASVPVLLLTALDTENDKVCGLDLGADDYITKPFGVRELVARVKARLRAAGKEAPENDLLSSGDLTVCRSRHTVTAAGKDVTLTLKEYDLLVLLLSANGAVLTREKLLSVVWGYDYAGESRTVDVHIRSLRKKLGAAGDCIRTVHGIGYKISTP